MINIRVEDRTPELMQRLESGLRRFVVKGAGIIHARLNELLKEEGTGRTYPRGKTGTHRASAPGMHPVTDSGNLAVHIFIALGEASLEAKIGTPVEYGRYLEDGTSKMAARPMWNPVAEESLPTLEALLAAEIKGAH